MKTHINNCKHNKRNAMYFINKIRMKSAFEGTPCEFPRYEKRNPNFRTIAAIVNVAWAANSDIFPPALEFYELKCRAIRCAIKN